MTVSGVGREPTVRLRYLSSLKKHTSHCYNLLYTLNDQGNVNTMGFLNFLFGGKASANREVVPDRIWLTTDAKFAGIAKNVTARANSGTVAILLVAHFPDVLARLNGIAAESSALPVKALLARDLSPELAASLTLDDSATIDVIVAERHPLPSVDDRLEEFADAFAFRCRFSHHLSLDDAIVQVFAGSWVQGMLGRLGMTEDESIEGTMISRRIKRAQRKIESKTYESLDADSATEWLEKNCPELVK